MRPCAGSASECGCETDADCTLINCPARVPTSADDCERECGNWTEPVALDAAERVSRETEAVCGDYWCHVSQADCGVPPPRYDSACRLGRCVAVPEE